MARPHPVADELNDVVSLAVSGDRRAIARVLAFVQPLVLRHCRARLGSRPGSVISADDVAQDVCVAVLRALPSYERRDVPLMALVYRITSCKLADAFRRAGRDRTVPMAELPDRPDESAGPEQRAMHSELSGTLGRLLDGLPAPQREVLLLRVTVGLTAEETARAVNSTAGAVRVAQHRALGRLRSAAAGSSLER